jgi:hypothetical protein
MKSGADRAQGPCLQGTSDTRSKVAPVSYLDWLRWWKERGALELEGILVRHWDPLGIRDDPQQTHVYTRWVVRIGMRLRHGVSAEEIFELLASANRQPGVRVNTRQLAAVAIEIRRWYRQERHDPARYHWPIIYTEHER